MIHVPDGIKEKFRKNAYTNVRVSFPNGEHPDITNENIAAESFTFEESLCSQSPFKLGLCEASAVSFDAVGIPNIKGKQIDVSMEVDASGVQGTAQQQFALVSSTSSGGTIVSEVTQNVNFSLVSTDPTLTDSYTTSLSIDSNITITGVNLTLKITYTDMVNTVQLTSLESMPWKYTKRNIKQIDITGTIKFIKSRATDCSYRFYFFLGTHNGKNSADGSKYDYDLHRWIYSVPLGRFTVDSCPVEAGDIHPRKVQAYSDDFNSIVSYGDKLPDEYADYLRGLIANGETLEGNTIQSLFTYLTGTYTKKIAIDYITPNGAATTFSQNFAVPGSSSSRQLIVVVHMYQTPDVSGYDLPVIFEYTKNVDWKSRVETAIDEALQKSGVTPDQKKKEELLNNTIRGINEYFQRFPEKKMYYKSTSRYYLPLNIDVHVNGSTTSGTYDLVNKISGNYYGESNQIVDETFYNYVVDDPMADLNVTFKIEDMLEDGFTREFVEAYVELCGALGKCNRKTHRIEIFKPRMQKGLHPDIGLHPNAGLYPEACGGDRGFTIFKSMYGVYGEPTKKYSKVTVTYTNYNEEVVEESVEIVNLEEKNADGTFKYNADEYQVYDFSDNMIAQKGRTNSGSSARFYPVMEIACTNIAETLRGISYSTVDVDCPGMPYVEAGDVAQIQTDQGFINTLILKRTLAGINIMTDTFESQE